MADPKRLVTISMDTKHLRKELETLRARGHKRGITNVVNNLAFDSRDAVFNDMKRVFYNPTKWTLGMFKVIKARPNETEAVLATKDLVGGKTIGTAAARYLSPDVFGGEREMKPSEHALSKISGGQYWVPGDDAPLDGSGNIKGATIRTLLAHLDLNEDPEKNLSQQRSRTLRKNSKNAKGKRGQYFVARYKDGKRPLGIYKYSGTPGKVLQIIRFVATPPHYRKILPVQEIVDQTVIKNVRQHVDHEIFHQIRRALKNKKTS